LGWDDAAASILPREASLGGAATAGSERAEGAAVTEGSQRLAGLGDFARDRRLGMVSLMGIAVGAVGALVARGLVWLIDGVTNLAYYGRFSTQDAVPIGGTGALWAVLVPIAGGLVVGLMARYGSEKIRGHGIPEALEAILIGRSRLSFRVAVLKPLASAIAIGTGLPFGAEGPIIMTGGAFGSLFGQQFRLTAVERKTLLVAGAAAGMSAIFAAPIAAVLLAVELLLFEWRPRSFIPVAMASATAAAVRKLLFGVGPLFDIVQHDTVDVLACAWSPAIGVLAGFAGAAVTYMVYRSEDLFRRLPIHWTWWPVIGGLVVGLCGVIEPRILGIGYDTIRELLDGNPQGSMLVLLVIKALAWAVALGSGASGGVLAPLLLMGAAMGAMEAEWIPAGDASLWAAVGMAAMMSAAMRVPLTGIVFAVELTHDVAAFPVILGACATAHLVSVLILPRSVLTEKLARRGTHVAAEYGVDPFTVTQVSEVMDPDPPLAPASITVGELSSEIVRPTSRFRMRQGTILVDAQGKLAGIVTRSDILRAMEVDGGDLPAIDAGTIDPVVGYPDELVSEAVTRMLRRNIGRLPIVSRDDPRKVVGYLGRAGILAARMRLIQEETIRE
jgi:CIC family chloride channel protein